ncbi:conserved hypothetical protein [Gloeothece citriformis PCC 7424]|uniref:HetZ-related protein 2 n=1 Tax=Gloeothece citriformis (strain PCC 7424) TaxID=65393 RepID=B7KES0_GLOC7|nr:HetZ-related protein 2 [Gloeothece citriformis]ACK69095.1 conserved hypothetical protein [Gloeothece citriformis PCC 7424]
MSKAEELEKNWHSRLSKEDIQLSETVRHSLINWLLGEDRQRFEDLDLEQLEICCQGMDYRYRILRQRYLFVSPTQAYKNLLNRLGSVVTLRNKIRTWVALSRDRQRAVVDVLQEVIQEMLKNDRYIQTQIAWISQCTQDERLRNSILFATIEEYSLRPIRNQPLLAYRFVNYLRRQSRGGMTQVPQQEIIRILSDEVGTDEDESSMSLLDTQAANQYQEVQEWEEKQTLRLKVQREFEAYLESKIDRVAVEWLRLYLAGRSQEAIAKRLNLPIKQIYRLREKVSYHAIKGFALKGKPELVASWLEISLKEHNLGLTPVQWEKFSQNLTPIQQEILTLSKSNKSLETIGQELKLKKSQILKEWSEIYLAAQSLRTDGIN